MIAALLDVAPPSDPGAAPSPGAAIAVLAVLWVALLIAYGYHVRRLRIAAARAEAERARAYEALWQVEQERDLHRRRADEFFAIIQGVENEAQTWRRMFKDGMAKAGAAQNWLIRDLSMITRIGNAYAARLRKLKENAPALKVDPQLQRFIEEFEQETQREVPVAPGQEAAEKIERELLGPAATAKPIEVPSTTHDPA